MSMVSLNGLCIDGVVLFMRGYELQENNPISVVDECNQPVLVASDLRFES